jgi:hypothetical protein
MRSMVSCPKTKELISLTFCKNLCKAYPCGRFIDEPEAEMEENYFVTSLNK